ncbi:uncharacterized protein VNE69_05084 [Vairimorpha necatrix]|uniref:Uncharacterized protein n=1 Tax=Vairimorpha necatrix TaxID=6039 RepID=A0AAX4JBX2_9MICR
MNNDLRLQIAKYLTGPLKFKEMNFTLESREFLLEKIDFTSKLLNNKFKNRPTLEELKQKNIIKNELIHSELKNKVHDILVLKENKKKKNPCVAPSISNLVKKMDFEYKKILIIHKLNIKRKK